MIKIDLYGEAEIRSLIKELYSDEDRVLNIEEEDFEKLFFEKSADEWMVAEYYGRKDEVKKYISAVNMSGVRSFFLHIFMNEKEKLTLASDITEIIWDSVDFTEQEMAVEAEISDKIQEEYIAFRMITVKNG